MFIIPNLAHPRRILEVGWPEGDFVEHLREVHKNPGVGLDQVFEFLQGWGKGGVRVGV